MAAAGEFLAQGHDMLLHAVEHVERVIEYECDAVRHGLQSSAVPAGPCSAAGAHIASVI